MTRTAFGSYRTEDVTWLLTDLSHVELEVPTEDREELIQGGRHYFEMLPVEYQPEPAYTQLFHDALLTGAPRIAEAVGLVSELVLDRHPDGIVLVSLARAGTPIGILMRRWLEAQHGLDVPHYTVSIVRGGGLDEVALQHVLDRHPPDQVCFVDGWTGKGAIAQELTAAVDSYIARHPEAAALSSELAVLADPGHCTSLFGTRDDFLIPSACLNSTVSGLVSRTVLRADLIGTGMFHGAKFYAELAPVDVSQLLIDTIVAAFDHAAVSSALPRHLAADRHPDWSGWEAVRRIADEHGIDSVNLVKPGVGETTRVLLRRVPWRVLVRPDRRADLEHVLLLTQARGVQVIEDPTLPYSCVGLIKPLADA